MAEALTGSRPWAQPQPAENHGWRRLFQLLRFWHIHCWIYDKPYQGEDMHQEPELSAAADASPALKTRKIKKILILALSVLLLGVGGGLVYLIFSDDPSLSGTPSQAAHAPRAEQAIMPLEPFLVNLADQEVRRYLKLKVELEVEQEKSVKELEKSLSPIRDALIMLLSSKTYAEISTLEGKRQLKHDILQRLAAIPGGQKAKNVYFTEFVAQ
jgi:flagellar FliL protein